jgi:RimJ/RimL family protein N-acetyltransferase
MKAILWKGRVAGTVGSFLWEGKPQVTYWIGKEFWGNGIATQALTALLHIVKDRPLYASTASDNAASIRVLEKCGFTMRGSAKAFAKTRVAEIDQVFFELAPLSYGLCEHPMTLVIAAQTRTARGRRRPR